MIIYGHENPPPVPIRQLADRARDASKLAYAPYSNYLVGAAILTTSGHFVVGSNQENASFPLCMCAERVALYHFSSLKVEDPIASLAVFANSSSDSPDLPPSPCGACRQVIAEFQSRQNNTFSIILSNQNGNIWFFESISELLPYAFDPSNLKI